MTPENWPAENWLSAIWLHPAVQSPEVINVHQRARHHGIRPERPTFAVLDGRPAPHALIEANLLAGAHQEWAGFSALTGGGSRCRYGRGRKRSRLHRPAGLRPPAAAVVAGAPLEIRNVDTGLVYRAASSATGNYSLTQLPVGQYEFSVVVPGVQKVRPEKYPGQRRGDLQGRRCSRRLAPTRSR